MRAWLNRQRLLFDFALSSLARRRGKNLGLWLVYTLLVALLASAMLFSHALRHEAKLVLAGTPEIIVQRLVAGRHDLVPASYLNAIRPIRGVQDAHGRRWGYLFDPVAKANYTVMVPRDRSVAAGKAVVGSAVAVVRNAAAGDIMSFRGHDGRPVIFEIARALPHESALVSADLLLVSDLDFFRLFGLPDDRFTDIVVTVRNPNEVRTVATKIDAALPDTRIILREEILRTYESVFDWREGILLVLVTGVGLAFMIFAFEKTSGLSAEERREIGVLKAIGWETGDVIRLKAIEGLLISLTAFIAGYLVAYVHVFHFGAPLFEPVLKGWAVLYPAFRLTPFVDGVQVATLFFFTVFPYTVATVVPIWRSATIDPDTVMR